MPGWDLYEYSAKNLNAHPIVASRMGDESDAFPSTHRAQERAVKTVLQRALEDVNGGHDRTVTSTFMYRQEVHVDGDGQMQVGASRTIKVSVATTLEYVD